MPTHIVSGRSVGLSNDKIAHLLDDPLPAGVYTAFEAAVVDYSRRLTRMQPIDDELFARLRAHLSPAGLVELCLVVGTANLVNRFHSTFHTDVDQWTEGALGALGASGAVCPLPIPPSPS